MDVDHANKGASSAVENAATTTNSILKSSYDIDVVRLIGQYLINMGLKQTANLLLEESGLHQLDHPIPMKFREHIMAGEWEKASQLVDDIVDLAVSSNSATNWIQPAAQATNVANKHQNGCNTTRPNSLSNSAASDVRRRSDIESMRLAIAEQKFLELLEDNDRIRALRCLRCEVTPLCKDVKRIQFLTTLLMCKSMKEIRVRANWTGKNQQTRQSLFDKISRFIPPPILLPPKRLETLLNQAVQLQKDRCILHIEKASNQRNDQESAMHSEMVGSDKPLPLDQVYRRPILGKSNGVATIISDHDHIGCNGICNRLEQTHSSIVQSDYEMNGQTELDNYHNTSGVGTQYDNNVIDLKSDHICSANSFPLYVKQALDSHNSEVWFCQFSNDGSRLATGGVNGKVIIWALDQETKMLSEKCILDCPCYSISCLSWSPDDTYLLACGSEDRPHLWIWNMETEQLHTTISHKEEEESTTTCSWHLSGKRFAAASIKGTFNIYDVNGFKRGSREGVRVQCLSFLHKDPNVLLAADTLNRIKAYRVDCYSEAEPHMSIKSEEEDLLEERYAIMSFIVDRDDRYIAVNVRDQGVNLWDLRRKTLLRIFLGVSQRNMTIYSSFSSPDSTFLASGSEDGRVYIYHISKDQPVAILNGHRRCVNCVSWNPMFPELLASVSDDHVVRLWAPADPGHPLHLCRSLSQVF